MMISRLDLLAISYQAYVSAFCAHAVSDGENTGRMKTVEFDKDESLPMEGFYATAAGCVRFSKTPKMKFAFFGIRLFPGDNSVQGQRLPVVLHPRLLGTNLSHHISGVNHNFQTVINGLRTSKARPSFSSPKQACNTQ